MEKEGLNLWLFICNMIVYLEKLRKLINKLLV